MTHPTTTAEPTTARVVLKHGRRAALATFRHLGESYRLDAGLFVEREHLIKRRQAQVLVRPSLTMHGVEVDLKLLEDVRLTVVSTDHAGVSSQKEFPTPTLQADAESLVTIQVPENLATLSVALTARVRAITSGKPVDLRSERTWRINGIETTEQAAELQLLGCGVGQGYLFAPPLPAEAMLSLLASSSPPPSSLS